MKYDTTIKAIKDQVNILDIAEAFYKLEKHGQVLHLVEKDSCVLYPKTNSYFRFSQGEGGDVIKFMTNVVGYSFKDAITYLEQFIDKDKIQNISSRYKANSTLEKKMTPLERNEKLWEQLQVSDNNKKIMAYLIQVRKINPNIVYNFIHEDLIKQVNYKGVECVAFMNLFLKGSQYKNMPIIDAVSVRACDKNNKFNGDLKHCSYETGWWVKNNPEKSKTLICFESYIDMMSYCTILADKGLNYKDFDYVVFGSVTKLKALDNILKDTYSNLNYSRVIAACDNDIPGKEANKKIEKKVIEKGLKYQEHRSKAKDWNEELVNLKELKLNKVTQR